MIDLTIKPDDGEPFKLTATSRDIYQWEKTNRGKTFRQLMETMPMMDLYQVAHIAARRQGLYDGSLQDFVTTCDVESEDEKEEPEEADPTPPAP